MRTIRYHCRSREPLHEMAVSDAVMQMDLSDRPVCCVSQREPRGDQRGLPARRRQYRLD